MALLLRRPRTGRRRPRGRSPGGGSDRSPRRRPFRMRRTSRASGGCAGAWNCCVAEAGGQVSGSWRHAMRRVVSVWLPHWPTDRLRRLAARSPEPPAPLVTASHDGRRRVIAASDPVAAALGLRPGMAVAQALAIVPRLAIAEAEPEADAAALERLARWCHRLTPLTAVDGTDGLWLDITGCAHLAGGEAALLRDLLARFARDGLHARAAVADTPGAAHGVARHGTRTDRRSCAQASKRSSWPHSRLPPCVSRRNWRSRCDGSGSTGSGICRAFPALWSPGVSARCPASASTRRTARCRSRCAPCCPSKCCSTAFASSSRC